MKVLLSEGPRLFLKAGPRMVSGLSLYIITALSPP